jgi:hypothetical protein
MFWAVGGPGRTVPVRTSTCADAGGEGRCGSSVLRTEPRPSSVVAVHAQTPACSIDLSPAVELLRSCGWQGTEMLLCLQIRLNDDLSLNEVAARLRLSLPATKTRLLRAKRRVIASAAARLLPAVRAGGKNEGSHWFSRLRRSVFNRLFGSVPCRECSRKSQQLPRENNRCNPAYFRITAAWCGFDNFSALSLCKRKHRQYLRVMSLAHPQLWT